jgi:flagellar basal-body rod protein FlgF
LPTLHETALAALQNDMQRIRVIANNMVNASTPGYRREVLVHRAFDAQLAQMRGSLPMGTPAGELAVDTSAGSAIATGQPLDVFIAGSGYFEVNGPKGVAYTRNGRFHLDPAGRLVTHSGAAVMGQAGEIVSPGGRLTISADGQVSTDRGPVDRLKVVALKGPGFTKTADGNLMPAEAATASPARSVSLRVGFIEGSNVATQREMVGMMEALRNFEALQKVMQGYDEQLGTALQKLGEF